MCVYKVLAIFCFLHLVFGVEFVHARPLYTRLEAKAGSKLVIPCVVTNNYLSGASSVGFEWGMIPEGGGPYTPILHSDITNLQKDQDKRFHMRLTHSEEEEDCTLVISPVLQSDSGTYEVRFTVDKVQHHPFKVIVHVTDPTFKTADTETIKKHQRNLEIQEETPSDTVTKEVPRTSPMKTTKTTTETSTVTKEVPRMSPMTMTTPETSTVTVTKEVPRMSPMTTTKTTTTTETSTYDSVIRVIDPDEKFIAKNDYQTEDSGYIQLAYILAVLGLLILIISAAIACCYGIKYFKRRRKMIDKLKRTEEGLQAMDEEGITIVEGDAEGKDVLVVMEERCTAKDEVCIMMDKRSGDMEGGINVREEMRTLLADVEETLIRIKQGVNVMEEELSETKKELTATNKELAATKGELAATVEMFKEERIIMEHRVAAMEKGREEE